MDSQSDGNRSGYGNGLVLFPPGTPPRVRRAKILFVAVVLAATASILWPIYPRFSGVRPMILGLPLSFAWVVLWLLAVFAGFLFLYRVQHGAEEKDGQSDEGDRR